MGLFIIIKMKIQYSYLLILLLPFLYLLSGCQDDQKKDHSTTEEITDREEAREDSLELVAAYERQAKITNQVQPAFETDAVAAEASFDAADDPAVWINVEDPAQSVIIGSNKKGGIYLYDLTGKTIAYFPVGNINNVDVLYGFTIGERKVDLVGGSNRSDQSIDLFAIVEGGKKLVDMAEDPLKVDSADIDDIYGFCFYHNSAEQKSYVFINGKNGRVQQFELQVTQSEQISLQKVRDIQFESQVEGMVADNLHGWLYVGEEDRGIWKLKAAPNDDQNRTLIKMSTEENPQISFDIEGLTLYEKGSEGYLIASSQGNFSYAIFERNGDNTYLTSFTISGRGAVDGVEETDGIEAISSSLGDAFPKGIFVAQDGFNYDGDTVVAQNFKVVDWGMIEKVLE
jgi:3-phytase